MANGPEVKIYDYITGFLDDLKDERPLDYDGIIQAFDTIYKIGIKKALLSKLIKKIVGHREKMHELKVSTQNTEYRLTGLAKEKEDELHLVHAFKKKDQKIRKQDIDITKKRLKKEGLI